MEFKAQTIGIIGTIGVGSLHMPRNLDFSPNEEKLVEFLIRIGEEAQKKNVQIVLDTAKAYGNVGLIGKFFKGHPDLRPYFYIVTKDGIDLMNRNKPYVTSVEELRNALNDSYDSLGKIDAILLHRIHHEWMPDSHQKEIDALYGELVELKNKSKCNKIGISECNATVLKYLAEKFGVDIFECAWSPFCRRIEKNGVYDVIKAYNIQTLTYSSVLRGLFNDNILDLNSADMSPTDLRDAVFKILGIESNPFENTVGFYDLDLINQNILTVQKFIRLAKLNDLSSAELSLACATHMGFIPIPGSSKIERILENVFPTKTINSNIIFQAMRDSEEFKGDPNPKFLDYLSDPTLNQ